VTGATTIPASTPGSAPGPARRRAWWPGVGLAALGASSSAAWGIARDPPAPYDAAAVRAMAASGHAFWFGAFDPDATITTRIPAWSGSTPLPGAAGDHPRVRRALLRPGVWLAQTPVVTPVARTTTPRTAYSATSTTPTRRSAGRARAGTPGRVPTRRPGRRPGPGARARGTRGRGHDDVEQQRERRLQPRVHAGAPSCRPEDAASAPWSLVSSRVSSRTSSASKPARNPRQRPRPKATSRSTWRGPRR
jgi:hypothetical protein